MSAHTCSSDKAAFPELLLQRFAINGSLLFLLPPPMQACSSGAVKGAIQVRLNHFLVMVQLSEQRWALRPRDARIRNKDVQPAIEIPNCMLNSRANAFVGEDVDLVCLA